MVKLAPLSAVLLSSFVAADAGSMEAQHDARLCAVYGAYRIALKSGNKTQLMLVQSACTTYATAKDCRALTDTPDRASAAATRACTVYAAYKLALDNCGIPSLMKGATDDAIDAEAASLAGCFVSIVTAALTVEPKPVKTAAEKEQAKVAKAAAEKVASEQVQAATAAIVEARVKAAELTLADMVRIVANAVRSGMIDPDGIDSLDSALDSVAASIELNVVEVEHIDLHA